MYRYIYVQSAQPSCTLHAGTPLPDHGATATPFVFIYTYKLQYIYIYICCMYMSV